MTLEIAKSCKTCQFANFKPDTIWLTGIIGNGICMNGVDETDLPPVIIESRPESIVSANIPDCQELRWAWTNDGKTLIINSDICVIPMSKLDYVNSIVQYIKAQSELSPTYDGKSWWEEYDLIHIKEIAETYYDSVLKNYLWWKEHELPIISQHTVCEKYEKSDNDLAVTARRLVSTPKLTSDKFKK